MRSLFRVKPYAHREYKFVVRAKLGGKWKRRYFRTEEEASAFATEQNSVVQPPDSPAEPDTRRDPSIGAIVSATSKADGIEWHGEIPERSSQPPAADASRRQIEARLERAARDSAELADARWEILTLRADFLRGKDATADVIARCAEAEDRANAAASERDQLRGIVLSLQKDLEQERLNVAAVDHRCRIAEQEADENEDAAAERTRAEAECAATAAQLKETERSLRALEQQLGATEDRADAAEASLRRIELRATASENQSRSLQVQLTATQEQLQATGKELASRCKQIMRLREQLGRRLILPFGKMQRRIDDLTKVAPSS